MERACAEARRGLRRREEASQHRAEAEVARGEAEAGTGVGGGVGVWDGGMALRSFSVSIVLKRLFVLKGVFRFRCLVSYDRHPYDGHFGSLLQTPST